MNLEEYLTNVGRLLSSGALVPGTVAGVSVPPGSPGCRLVAISSPRPSSLPGAVLSADASVSVVELVPSHGRFILGLADTAETLPVTQLAFRSTERWFNTETALEVCYDYGSSLTGLDQGVCYTLTSFLSSWTGLAVLRLQHRLGVGSSFAKDVESLNLTIQRDVVPQVAVPARPGCSPVHRVVIRFRITGRCGIRIAVCVCVFCVPALSQPWQAPVVHRRVLACPCEGPRVFLLPHSARARRSLLALWVKPIG